jgi:hypothetical protein
VIDRERDDFDGQTQPNAEIWGKKEEVETRGSVMVMQFICVAYA